MIPGGKADGPGRPPNLYRLRPNKRSELLYRLAEMRRELDGISMPSTEQLFAPSICLRNPWKCSKLGAILRKSGATE